MEKQTIKTKDNKLSENKSNKFQEYLKSLDGQEFLSLSREGCVLIEGNKIFQGGGVIGEIKTLKQAKELFNEMFTEEFGYAPGSKAMQRELEAEFGEKRGD